MLAAAGCGGAYEDGRFDRDPKDVRILKSFPENLARDVDPEISIDLCFNRELDPRSLDDFDARAIWVARAGYGATRLLPSLDPDRVRQSAKWLIGFSDATALHAVWRQAGLCSVHGPNVSTLARPANAPSNASISDHLAQSTVQYRNRC